MLVASDLMGSVPLSAICAPFSWGTMNSERYVPSKWNSRQLLYTFASMWLASSISSTFFTSQTEYRKWCYKAAHLQGSRNSWRWVGWFRPRGLGVGRGGVLSSWTSWTRSRPQELWRLSAAVPGWGWLHHRWITAHFQSQGLHLRSQLTRGVISRHRNWSSALTGSQLTTAANISSERQTSIFA